jgi:hypothetical protein
MTIFDLIFIGVFFATVTVLIAITVATIRGRGNRAIGLLIRLGVFITAYFLIVTVVSLVSPRRMILLKEPQCFDDWCVSVDHVDQTLAGSNILYAVTIRLYSRARGRAQRENGVKVYVLDDQGRRYEPQEDPQAVPFNILLNPGDSVIALRRFSLPAQAQNPELVIMHGKFPGLFIIGDDQSLFHKPSAIRFP